MKPVALLRHGPTIGPGYLGEVLADRGIPAVTVALYSGAPLPDPEDVSAVVSLGGLMGAYEEDRYPYLTAEKAYLRGAVGAGLPVLGICLGCQLLAATLGGRAFRAASAEVAVASIELTAAGRADPVTIHLDGPVLVWHQDTWEPPSGAVVLARTDGYPQAFRLGSALGLQPHPEASPEITAEWIATGGREWLAERGFDSTPLASRPTWSPPVGRPSAPPGPSSMPG